MKSGARWKRRTAIAASGVVVLIGASLWVRAQLSDARPVSSLMPPGALLYLEAKDFHSFLANWNNSAEKKRWANSKNYDVVSRSRLIGRLSQAQQEFAAVAGVPIAMQLADQVAGARSAFAFYNLSALTFVYLTQMPQNQVETTELWRARTHYQSRDVSGIPFYVKSDDASHRVVAFANYKDWLVLTTNEDLMAETLVLLSGQKGASIATEPWFMAAAQKSQTPGDLRLVYNLTELLATPQFRTYWLQRNASELKPFSAGISDLFDRQDAFEEQRIMLRATEIPVTAGDGSLSEVLAYAPASSSLYRAWSMTDSAQLTAALQQVVLGDRVATALYNPPAPAVTSEAGAVGSEADLEIRIDEPPFQRASQQSVTPLVNAIFAMQPTALLYVQTTAMLRDQVFVMPNSGAVVVCKHPDSAALDKALAQSSSITQTGSLDPLHVSVEGNALVLTRIELSRKTESRAVPADATYTAVYNHALEWPHYTNLFAILDRSAGNPEMQASPETPPFFSGNLQSVGETLSRLRRASIVSADKGPLVREAVRYELAQP